MIKGSLALAGGALGTRRRGADPRRADQESVGRGPRLATLGDPVGSRWPTAPRSASRRSTARRSGPRTSPPVRWPPCSPGCPAAPRPRTPRSCCSGCAPSGHPDPDGPGDFRLRRLLRVLEDLHARRLPGLAVRAADRPGAVPVPPVPVRRLRRACPVFGPATRPLPQLPDRAWTTRATSSRRERLHRAGRPRLLGERQVSRRGTRSPRRQRDEQTDHADARPQRG